MQRVTEGLLSVETVAFDKPTIPVNRIIALKRDRAHRSNPAADLGGICLVHIEEMRHHRLHDLFAAVIRCHGDNAAKDLDQSAVPVFGHVVKCGEPRIDEGPQILTDRLASIPFRDTEATPGILHKAVKTFAEGLVIDFLPKSQKPFRWRGFREG